MSFPIHPDDMPSPRFGGWADDFNTYDEACEFYGADTPAQIAAEQDAMFQEECIEIQDMIELEGPRPFLFVSQYRGEIIF